MKEEDCRYCKLSCFSIFGVLCAALFFVSLTVDYQWELAKEHVRFRNGFPSQAEWIKSPYGTLNCYLFNVTNSEEFLAGTDSKLKIQQIGPIVYRIKGRNNILNINNNDSTMTYEKIRYHELYFDEKASCAPDILNQTIISPNFIILSAAAKLHDWVFLVRHAFNAITINEPIFLNQSVYYYLWNFSTPALEMLSDYIPNIVSNCGMLYNALRKKDEIYNVNIGLKHGIENFFRVNYLNNKTVFSEQNARLKYLNNDNCTFCCPIEVPNSFDNSLFPPFLKPDDKLTIVAGESCRILPLNFNKTQSHLGFRGYRYNIADQTDLPSCLDNAMGIKLHKGMFDVSKCLFNDVPSAFSSPHFYGSTYDWTQHFEGFTPNAAEHETFIVIEPINGIPIEEKYRFQSNIPMPDMTGYSKKLELFSHMVIPTFWYEYDLDDLPTLVVVLMKLSVFIVPVLQPILIICYLLLSVLFFMLMFLKLKRTTFKELVNNMNFKK